MRIKIHRVTFVATRIPSFLARGRVVFSLLAVGLPLALAALAAPACSQAGYTRQDTPDEHYLTGYLAWNGGKGTISWDSTATSEDPASITSGSSPPAAAAPVGAASEWLTGSDGGLTPRITFTSQPLPRALLVNASRLIEVDLYFVQPQAVENFDLRLTVNGQLVAGAVRPAPVYPTWAPPTPPGYMVKTYRLQTEQDRISKGDQVVITLTPTLGYASLIAPPKLGTAGDHRSIIRIPFYSEEDSQLRFPSPARPDDPTDTGQPNSAPITLLGAVPLGAGFLLATGRRRRPALLALLLVSISLSGCTSQSSAPPLAASAPMVAPEDGDVKTDRIALSNESKTTGNGSITGTVHDEQNMPLPGAFVVLFGSDRTAVTTKLGRFDFPNLTVGDYRIRIDREAFKSIEIPVRVDAGFLTNLDITMVPAVGANLRAHLHDYWAGQTTLLLLEQDVEIHTNGDQNKYCTPGSYDCFGYVKFPDAAPDGSAIILPGTYDVEVTVTWTASSSSAKSIGVGFRSNNEPGYEQSPGHVDINYTLMYPRPSGVPTHIRTAWEMGDVGHQVFSTWQIFINVPRVGFFPAVVTNLGTYHVKVVLHKGIVPLEPGHRDFWGGKTTLPILDGAAIRLTCPSTCALPDDAAKWVPPRLIPPGTSRLTITLNADQVAMPTPTDWVLLFKAADTPPTAPRDFAPFKPVADPSGTALSKSYEMRLTAIQTDQFYSQHSNWAFAVDDGKDGQVAYTNAITLKLSVTAHRDEAAGAASAALDLLHP